MSDKPRLNQETFKLIAAAAGAVALVVLLVGVFGLSPMALFTKDNQPASAAPRYFIHDEASFLAAAKPYNVEPTQSPELAFEIQLPPEWTVETAAPTETDFGKRIISEIARLTGPYVSIYRPQVIVQTIALKHDIAAESWLRHHILSNSFILQGYITAISKRRASAAFTYIDGNDVILVQSVVQFSGANAVLARYEIPLAFKDALGFVQRRAIESFKLITLVDTPVEEQKPFTLADMVKFSYPQSWTASSPDLRDMNRINIQLYHQSSARVYQGYLHVFVVKRRPETDLHQEFQRLRDFVTDHMKLDVVSLHKSDKAPANPRFNLSRLESYAVKSQANPNAAQQEITLAALGNSNIYVFALMLSPDPARDLYSWGRNQRTLELIVQSIE